MKLTAAEEARNVLNGKWGTLPTTQARVAELLEVVRAQGGDFNADGFTAAIKAFQVLQAANPIPLGQDAIDAGLIR